jgi:hypothetical protein
LVIVPSEHGKFPVQAPALDTKPRPAGVGSATDTPVAVLGPLFVTVMVYTTFVPAVTFAGPVFVSDMSAWKVTVVCTDAVLFAGVGSVVVETTVAVFVKGFAPE